jgi:hypothetical protein
VPAFRTGVVVALGEERTGLQKVDVDLEGTPARAYVLTALTGPVAVGDRVVLNTTAVDLGLGTGGWHFVHWNLERSAWVEPGPGHIMKLRYTSLQADVGSTEEHLDADVARRTDATGLPVVATPLHSQLPAVAVGVRHARPGARIAYVMTDGASLPLALSDLVAAMRDRGLVDTTITCGHAFGGDHEAVNVHAALMIARHLAGADVAIVGMGPGIVGTGTALGFTGMEVGAVLDAATGLGGVPIACLRASAADPRDRHVGISHHTVTTLTVGTRSRVTVPVPAVGSAAAAAVLADLDESGIAARHDVVRVEVPDVFERFAALDLRVTSMGRDAAADPILFECAAAAGVWSVNGARTGVA